MAAYLEQTTCHNRCARFHVSQCVLTWDAGFIMSNIAGNLKNVAKTTMSVGVEWLKTKKRGLQGINIVIADFVELEDFCQTVIRLNYR